MGTTSKALTLLDHFSRSRPLIGLSQMARLAGQNKATTHRLLGELADFGMVEQTKPGREYRLGPAFLRLAALREHHVPMRESAYALLEELARETGETSHMSLLQGDVLSTLTYAYAQDHGTLVRMEDAENLALHATSSGLAVLAFSSSKFVDSALSGDLHTFTSQTETDPQKVMALLPQIRETGLAVSVGGFEEDVFSHAAPVFDASSVCIGAVAVAAPVSRMTDELAKKIRALVLNASRHLTRQWGGFPPDTFPQPTEALEGQI